MPAVHAFQAIRYRQQQSPSDVSKLIAPPYDVLDAAGKRRLLEADSSNIVSIDLPHLPAKKAGPIEAYQNSARTFQDWLAMGVLATDAEACMFAYRQTFTHEGVRRSRTGMACTLDLVPFGTRAGGGVLPHEETFSGPKEDRLALMRETRAQLSPIFGLHLDDQRGASKVLAEICASRGADVVADMGDGVLHEVWKVTDAGVIGAYQQALHGQDVFIADGHHRYTTALNYLADLEQGGKLAPDHPAKRCMFVLVGMSDPGLAIWPTHRVLGGMSQYSFDGLREASQSMLEFEMVAGGLGALEAALHKAEHRGSPRVGAFDLSSGQGAIVWPKTPDPLKQLHGYKPKVWRELDVAFVQYLIVEEICQPLLNEGCGVQWAFPHTLEEVQAIGSGQEIGSGGGKGFKAQLALIVRPTPLSSVREVSLAGDLMPQKSTFFYPKLATGLFMRSLA